MAIKLTVQAAFQSRKGAVIGREFQTRRSLLPVLVGLNLILFKTIYY